MPTYVIDPGHGKPDVHNIGISKQYYEHIGNFRVSQLIKENLQKDSKVVLTRNNDVGLSLTARANIAVANKADAFLSIHSDANASSSLKGVTVLRSVRYPETEALGNMLGLAVAAAMGTVFRGVKTRSSTTRPGRDYYSVIDVAATAGIKYTFIIERGFHTNVEDEAKLRDDNVNKAVANAISNVLRDYFNNSKEEDELNEYILAIQQALKNNGFDPGPLDGKPGPQTRDAVIAAINSAKNTSVGANQYILEIQQHLQKNGYNPGPLDGKPGTKTRDAVVTAVNDAKKAAATINNLQSKINKAKQALEG